MENKIISINISPETDEEINENAGVMWEHNATALVFNIDPAYVGNYRYYLEYRSLIGTKVRTEYFELDTETNTVTYNIPVTMTSLRGVECYFNIVKINNDGQTVKVIKSKKFCLEFDYSPDTDNSLAKVNDFSINALLEAIRLGTFKGDKGDAGEKGDKGDKGERGDRGEVGDIATVKSEILFYPEQVIKDKYINTSNGTEAASKGSFISGLMPLKLDTDYAYYNLKSMVYLYDRDGMFIGYQSIENGTFSVSSTEFPNATQFRIYGEYTNTTEKDYSDEKFKNFVESVMLLYGTEVPSEYTKYAYFEVSVNDKVVEDIVENDIFNKVVDSKFEDKTDYIGAEQIKDNSVSADKTDFMSGNGEVLFKPENCTLDYYVNSQTDGLSKTAGNFASDFIPLTLGVDYALSYSLISYKYVYLYDEAKAYIGYIKLTTSIFNITDDTFTVGGVSCANAKYFRISGSQTYNNGSYTDIMIVYGTELPSEITRYAKYDMELDYYFKKAIDKLRNKWHGKKVSCLGDSITYGYGLTNIETNRWTTLIKNLLYLSSIENYGLTSSPVGKSSESVTTSFVDRVTTMNNDSDLYIVLGGINDWRAASMVLGDITSTATNEFCGALNYIIEQIYTLNPNAEIVLMTPIQDLSYADGIDRVNIKGYTQKDYRDAIIGVAERHSIPVIDLYSLVGINEYNKSIYMNADNLHPSVQGHAKMAEVIAKELLRR